MNLNAIDLFCGGGGLTEGLKQAGFNVIGAVEIKKEAVATYVANHPEVNVCTDDIVKVSGLQITNGEKELDLLSACPPCQGFSSLTAKYHRDDPRNYLINEVLRLVKELMPRCLMIENVPGLANKGKSILMPFISELENLGYVVHYDVLQVADYGVPQFRRRFVLLAGLGFEIPIPEPTHNKYGIGKPKWVSIRKSLMSVKHHPIAMGELKNLEEFDFADWHVIRTLSPLNVERLKYAKPGKSWRDIPENLRPPCHRNGFNGFSNVYGRMDYNDVAPTITGGCTTLSKGRFGHPSENRAISVREAALLQSFPMNYQFVTKKMDTVCTIIGNALPPLFAKKIALQVKDKLCDTKHSN